MPFPIRSPHDSVSGIVLVARLIDKVRLHDAGRLRRVVHFGGPGLNRLRGARHCQ